MSNWSHVIICTSSAMPLTTPDSRCLRVGMIGLGMIFHDTYRPVFEQLSSNGIVKRDMDLVEVELTALASRTGKRVDSYRGLLGSNKPVSFTGPDAVRQLLASGVDVVCVATPDNRHFEPARAALAAGKHVLI